MSRHRKHGSSELAFDENKSDDHKPQEQVACLEQRLNDPEWQPLAKHIRKKLGEEFTLDVNDLLCLVHGSTRRPRFPWPMRYSCTTAKLLAALSPHGPELGRQLLDEVLDDQREKRKRPTAERNATWKNWQVEEKMGPTEIARRWRELTREIVEPNAIKQALRRTRYTGWKSP